MILTAPVPKVALDVLVGDDRQPPAEERQDRVAADQVAVPLVVGVDGHRRVAEERLGSRRRHADPRVGVGGAVLALEVIADRPERAGLFAVDVLEVADRGQAARTPVDERLAAIDQPGVPQPLEGDADGARAPLVHGESLAAPVQAGAEAAQLVADDRARLVHELPHALEVPLAPERRARLALGGDDLVEHELRADAGVVDARQPERVVAAHAVVADHDVLHDERQGMPDVQRAGDVRRRLDDDEALGAGGRLVGRAEGIGCQPALVDRRLDRGGVVARCELASRRRHRCAS